MEGIATEVVGAVEKTASGLESSGVSEGIKGLGATSALANDQQEAPQAYLNYLVYDEDYQLVDQGFVAVSEAAAVGAKNPDAAPEELALEVPIEEDGFVYAYLSNGVANSSTPVHFDDFTVEQQSYIVQVNDYYPFGGLHSQASNSQLVNKYLFNGKERTQDFGLGWDDFGARRYMPDLGRWIGPDPLADEFPTYSPYNYAVNNPLLYIDPNGEFPIKFHIRSFAPTGSFSSLAGLGFQDDGRGFTTSTARSVTSRISQEFVLETDNGSISNSSFITRSDYTINRITGRETLGSPIGEISSVASATTEDGATTFGFSSSFRGRNEQVPLSPDIAVSSFFSVTEDKGASTLTIDADIFSKQFPATEAFVTDPSGQSLFLGVGAAYGNPGSLVSADKKQVIDNQLSIGIDADGNFQNVTFRGTSYSIQEFNKQFQSQNPGPFDRDELTNQ